MYEEHIERLQQRADEYRREYSRTGHMFELTAAISFEFDIKCARLGKRRDYAIAELFDRGLGYEAVGRIAGLSTGSVRKWVRRVKAAPIETPYTEAPDSSEYYRLNKMRDFLQQLGETQ